MSDPRTGWATLAESRFGVRLTQAQLAAFERYSQELTIWNRRVNLTAITDPGEIGLKHFLDSLSCLLELKPRPGDRLVDVGTGAGFPGIPLKLAQPTLRLVLVESIGKKADFCRHIVERLELADVEVLEARAEAVGRDPKHRERYDWAVARAVAPLPVLLEYLMPLLRIGGRAIVQKGTKARAEAGRSRPAIEVLGGELMRVVPVELPELEGLRHLIVVAKVAPSPAKYPRRPGIAAKRPIRG
jgi:16S rRNA (guanine527-N7)-methyltransferase